MMCCSGYSTKVLVLVCMFTQQLSMVSSKPCSGSEARALPVLGLNTHARQQFGLVSLKSCSGLRAKFLRVHGLSSHAGQQLNMDI